MASKRRSILYLLAGAAVVAVRGADEAASLLARGTDEAVEAAGKGGDDAVKSGDDGGSLGDDLANTSKRAIRHHSLELLYEDATVSDSFSLSAGYYAGYKIDPGHRTQLTFEYTAWFDEPIDAFLLDEQAFSEYTSTGEINTGDQLTLSYAPSETHTETLSPVATYYLIFDNTDAGLTRAKEDIQINTEASLAIVD